MIDDEHGIKAVGLNSEFKGANEVDDHCSFNPTSRKVHA